VSAERRFYITTAIDYVNGEPHLGHAYEKITTDVIARWRRLCGDEVRFLTGSDEHGIKVQKVAAQAGVSPKEFVDGLVPAFEEAWRLLEISHDRFIRTTDADHERAVGVLLERIQRNGHLFDQVYRGWYCEGCEAFKTDKDLLDGRCPIHPTREPRWLEEDNLFFRLSSFQEPLLDHIARNPSFVEPESRRNEVLAVLREGLQDISISRSEQSVSWGIPIPFRPGSVVYVWFDALINYLSGAGFGSDDALYEKWWPADVHVIGKDITRFHCIIWPAMLLAAGVPLPRQVFAHGWVQVGGERMSKSSGVVVDPREIARRYGPDPLRWFLVSEVAFGRDGEFSWQRFEDVYTAHLCNGWGNLLSRAIGMADKYFGGVPRPPAEGDTKLRLLCQDAVASASAAYDGLRLHEAAAAAFRIVGVCNEQVQAREPWKMAKDPARRDELAAFLWSLLESVRVAATLLQPIMPRKAAQCLAALEVPPGPEGIEAARWGGLGGARSLKKPEPLFPRLDQLLQPAAGAGESA
jgi:methionyl-tRNA synthetase